MQTLGPRVDTSSISHSVQFEKCIAHPARQNECVQQAFLGCPKGNGPTQDHCTEDHFATSS